MAVIAISHNKNGLMNSKWLRMILAEKNKEVKVFAVIDGRHEVIDIVAVEDETENEIILALDQNVKKYEQLQK